MDLCVQSNLLEDVQVYQWAVELASKYGSKINSLFALIVEADTKRLWPNRGKVSNQMYSVNHSNSLAYQRFARCCQSFRNPCWGCAANL
jgi:hypothetical protein